MTIFNQVIDLKNDLDALRPLDKEREAIVIQKFRLDWNYHSNHIEGNSLTFGETKALILFGITAQGKPLKDHFEITGHNEALNWIFDVVKEHRPITETFIRELHQLLLKESYEVDAITPDGKPTKKRIEIGKYKSTENHVLTKTGEIFRFATPEETPAKMYDLLQWYEEKSKEKDLIPVILAAEFHYRFIRIHPFDDGNGRTARILMNLILLQFGYPPVIIKTQNKAQYFAVLQQADAGIFEPFAEYIAQNLLHSLEIMLAGANGENIEEPDDLDKEIALLGQRINGVARTKKNEESVLNLYDNSIIRLSERFKDNCDKFQKLYTELYFRFEVVKDKDKEYLIREKGSFSSVINVSSGTGTITTSPWNREVIEDVIKGKEVLKIYQSSIYILCSFKKLKKIGLVSVNYDSQVKIDFEESNYIVTIKNHTISKKYTEELSDNEIDKIVKIETQNHLDFIKEKLEEAEI